MYTTTQANVNTVNKPRSNDCGLTILMTILYVSKYNYWERRIPMEWKGFTSIYFSHFTVKKKKDNDNHNDNEQQPKVLYTRIRKNLF